ncbi:MULTISPECIES: hypothetical protein [Staphylococcus]|uniref:Uncharacterized protein n=1 Tax=Staphylococcus hsinchuensis TaxID=3051183 RepID=A0ABZ3EF70_9STAP|nr:MULTISPECIES: hypothetical protein [unclassified Staphylococcus]
MKALNIILNIIFIGILIYGVIMMISDLLGYVEFDGQILIIGIAMIALSELIKHKTTEMILLMLGTLLIIFG